MVELHENTNINRNEQLEHVSCSIIVSSFCFGSTDVQGHKQCSGTQQNSGFAIQHVSTFMLTVAKIFFIPNPARPGHNTIHSSTTFV